MFVGSLVLFWGFLGGVFCLCRLQSAFIMSVGIVTIMEALPLFQVFRSIWVPGKNCSALLKFVAALSSRKELV